MAYTLSLVQWMRHVICEGTLLKKPLAVGASKDGQGREKEDHQYSLIHKPCLEL
jgi:hypothetical protein